MSKLYIVCFFIMNILKSIKEIIIVFLLQYCILLFGGFIYYFLGFNLNNFMIDVGYYIVVIFNILAIIYLLKRYPCKIVKDKLVVYFSYIFFVICYSIIINNIYFLFDINNNSIINLNIFFLILSSGIIGPIVEELLFRRILLIKLVDFYGNNKAMVISSFIFALFHTGIFSFIYAFILGILLSYIYIKKRNIILVILAHMLSNIFILFLTGFNLYIFILCGIGIVISGCLIYKNI